MPSVFGWPFYCKSICLSVNRKSIAADPGAGIGLVTIGLTVNYDHLINLLVFGWPFYSNLFNCEL